MFNYKKEKIYLGDSDGAEVIVCTPHDLQRLHFGEDGSYSAYITHNAKENIPAYYDLEFTVKGPWLRIYDDTEKTATLAGARFNFYRAGEFGCIIDIED